MNKILIFLIIATSILVLSAIVICVSPIINNIEVNAWRPANWRNLNCQIFADKIKEENVKLNDLQKYKKYKNICYRQKAMYGLENSAFIINIILTFVCVNLTLLHYLNVGKSFEKKTGLMGLIAGIIGFILTLAYVCFSGYIFNNDAAYGIIDTSSLSFNLGTGLTKLYPNGASYKFEFHYQLPNDPPELYGKYIKVSEEEKGGEYPDNLLYKDLGKKQYNYNTEYYITHTKNFGVGGSNKCDISLSGSNIKVDDCDYLYDSVSVITTVQNKYIYDRWLTALILAIFIVLFNVALSTFGFLLFKNNEESAPLSEQTPIIYKK